jgi:hypothetical protein
MQPALSPEVLFPLVAGAAVAIAVIVVIAALGRGKRPTSGRPAEDDPATGLTSADWTGEAATGDPAALVANRVAVVGPHRLTVAEAVAVREADTAPLPVLSSTFVPDGRAGPDPGRDAADRPPAVEFAPAQLATAQAATDQPATGEPPTAQPTSAAPAAAEQPDGASPMPVPTESGDVPASRPAAVPTGSDRAVAAAVAQALAVRAAARETPTVPARDGRDRLLAVLLDDPDQAVAAAEELQACRGQLGEVLARLAAAGLRADQLARLSGFSEDEVGAMLVGSSSQAQP